MYKNSLMINSLETEREKHFKNKVKFILNYYTKETLIEGHSNLRDMEELLLSDTLNFVDIFYCLTKKYYLSNVKETEINREFNVDIKRLDFEYAQNKFLVNENLRKQILSTYIDNIDIPNNFLASEKTYTNNYDEINKTIEELNVFCLIERFKDINNSPKILKKSYY